MTNPTDAEILDYVEGNGFTFEKRPSGMWFWKGCGHHGHLPTLRLAALQAMKTKKEMQNKELDAAWKLFRERTCVGLTQDEHGFWHWECVRQAGECSSKNRDEMVLDYYRKYNLEEE